MVAPDTREERQEDQEFKASRAQSCTPVISALWEAEASLTYKGSPGQPGLCRKILSQKKNHKTKGGNR